MKKHILAIIALALAGIVVAGCSQDQGAPPEKQTKQGGKTPDGKTTGGDATAQLPAN